MSHLECNSTSSNSSEHNNAKSILLTTQYIMTSIGALANLVTFIVLQKGFSTFSPVNLFLLKSQAMIDLIICTCGTIMVLQTPMWITGNFWFDSIVCHLWHGQFIYWTFVFTSIWNLVIMAYDRFLAICKPFVYGEFDKCKVLKLSSLLFPAGIFATSGALFQIKMKHGNCVSEYLISGVAGNNFFVFYGIWLFIMYYLGPTVIFCILYGRIIVTLMRLKRDFNHSSSFLINSAAKHMTKTAMTVTVIFILSMSWDFWYYLLGRAGLVSYVKNTLLQMIGLWLSSLNSVANPFVYMLLLPAFRKLAISTMCHCMKGRTERSGISDSGPDSVGSRSTGRNETRF